MAKLYNKVSAVFLSADPKRATAMSLVCLCAGLSPEHELPQCLLLLSVLGQIHSQPEEVLQLWHTGSQFSEEEPR